MENYHSSIPDKKAITKKNLRQRLVSTSISVCHSPSKANTQNFVQMEKKGDDTNCCRLANQDLVLSPSFQTINKVPIILKENELVIETNPGNHYLNSKNFI